MVDQPLHKRGRVWYLAYMQVVPVLMQHLWTCYEDLALDWPVCTGDSSNRLIMECGDLVSDWSAHMLGIAPSNRGVI